MISWFSIYVYILFCTIYLYFSFLINWTSTFGIHFCIVLIIHTIVYSHAKSLRLVVLLLNHIFALFGKIRLCVRIGKSLSICITPFASIVFPICIPSGALIYDLSFDNND